MLDGSKQGNLLSKLPSTNNTASVNCILVEALLAPAQPHLFVFTCQPVLAGTLLMAASTAPAHAHQQPSTDAAAPQQPKQHNIAKVLADEHSVPACIIRQSEPGISQVFSPSAAAQTKPEPANIDKLCAPALPVFVHVSFMSAWLFSFYSLSTPAGHIIIQTSSTHV